MAGHLRSPRSRQVYIQRGVRVLSMRAQKQHNSSSN
uniref:Uncharacterized protein n=1 Tax=Anguilla anguilla TaxID=7936 RepID=A0A0E9UGR1_ANGAN